MRILFLTVSSLVASSAMAVDLNEALSYAYVNNTALQSIREDVKTSAEQTSQALSGFLPTIKWDRTVQKQKGNLNNQLSSAEITSNTRSRVLSINQNLFNSGASLVSLKVAKKSFDATVQKVIGAEQDFMNKAITAYVNTLNTKEALEINKNNIDVLKQTLDMTQERFKYGELTITDVATAKSKLASAQAEYAKANGEYINAKANYRTYFGKDADDLKVPSMPENIAKNLEDLIEIAKKNNPNLLSSRANAEASGSSVLVATSNNILPSLSLNASSTRQKQKLNPNAFIPNAGNSKQATIDLTIPIYKGGAEYSKIRESKIAYQKAQFDESSVLDSTIQGAISAWQGLETYNQAVLSQNEAVEAAKTSLEGTKQEFAVGTKTLNDVLIAEQNLFTAKLNLSTSKYQELLAAYSIYSVAGKLTAQGLGLNVDYFDPSKYYHRSWNILPNLITK